MTREHLTTPQAVSRTPRWRVALGSLLWITGIFLSMTADRSIAESVHRHAWDDKPHWTRTSHILATAAKLPGEYLTVLAAAVAVGIWQRRHWHGAGLVALAGLISGVNGLVKWVVGRHRPVSEGTLFRFAPLELHPFAGGPAGFFREKNLCFPSGHTALAFAAAAALAICFPRWRVFLFALAAVTGIERIVENAHYFSDVVAAAALGILSAHLAAYLIRKAIPPVAPRGFAIGRP